jgi:hypothetical protein
LIDVLKYYRYCNAISQLHYFVSSVPVIISVHADLRPSWWFIFDAVLAFGYFHYVDMGSFANIVEAPDATIFSPNYDE